MRESCPVGVFDSGVGGLSILRELHQLMPAEKLIYVADSAHAPYGQKGSAYINERCQAIVSFLLDKKVKAVVLACNTATAAAVANLRAQHELPIIGVEPAIKPAAEQSSSAVVGVLATAGTIDSEKFLHLKSRYTDQVEIITTACIGLVEEIERLVPDRQKIIAMLEDYTRAFREKGGDVLVLGCTHYALITELITEVVGEQVKIINTGLAVARETRRRLQEAQLLATEEGEGGIEFYTSGLVSEQERIFAQFWEGDIKLFSLP